MSYQKLSEILNEFHDESHPTPRAPRVDEWTTNWKEYPFVRLGIPHGLVDFEECKDDREKLIDHYYTYGWKTRPTVKNPLNRWVNWFRINLELWDTLKIKKSLSSEEIYIRCLAEGPLFADELKRLRSQAVFERTNEIKPKEMEVFEYEGYDSILNERYLIHWDDRNIIEDWKYSLIPPRRDPEAYEDIINKLIHSVKVEANTEDLFDKVAILKGTKTHSHSLKRNKLMRDVLYEFDIRPGYYAKRAVVPTTPASTRDTGVADGRTLVKLKVLNELAKQWLREYRHSAVNEGWKVKQRYARLCNNQYFIHIDFKKYGYTYPRKIVNMVIRGLLNWAGIDPAPFIIDTFYLDTEEGVYETLRGTVLGWLDPLASIGYAAIIDWVIKKKSFRTDFMFFNDDVEIGLTPDSREQAFELEGQIIDQLTNADYLVSPDKCYVSKMSIFLENYVHESRVGLNMYKGQLIIGNYSASLVTKYPWQAKLLFAAAYPWYCNEDIEHRCLYTCPIEFGPEEKSQPLIAGGFFLPMRNRRDDSLNYAAGPYLMFALTYKFDEPKVTIDPPKDLTEKAEVWATEKFYRYPNTLPRNILERIPEGYPEEIDIALTALSAWVGGTEYLYTYPSTSGKPLEEDEGG